jgi:hypothetical protein
VGKVLPLDEVIVHPTPPDTPIAIDPSCRYLCNPGSIGQPRDADPRASYAVLDMDEMTFSVHRVEYDISAAQAATLKAGLPPILAERLATIAQEVGRGIVLQQIRRVDDRHHGVEPRHVAAFYDALRDYPLDGWTRAEPDQGREREKAEDSQLGIEQVPGQPLDPGSKAL